jgi:hypothetical protein
MPRSLPISALKFPKKIRLTEIQSLTDSEERRSPLRDQTQNPVVVGIGDIQKAVWSDRDAVGPPQIRSEWVSPRRPHTGLACPRNRAHPVGFRIKPADHMILRIRHQNAAIAVHAQMFGPAKGGFQSRATVSAPSFLSRAGHGFDSTLRIDIPQGVPTPL